MKRVGPQTIALAVLLAVLVGIALASASAPPSTYSTYDSGRNGFLALYNVLARSGIPVSRLESPLAQLSASTRVFAVTPPQTPAFGSAVPIAYGDNDLKRLQAFLARGGTILAFGTIRDLKKSKRLIVLNAASYTNAALDAHPANAVTVYHDLAGRGAVTFDERMHGYDRTASLWAILPQPVRAACWIALAALVLWLIDANLRPEPPISIEPPAERDSSDYIRSMARLLRRARAGRAAVARFAAAYPQDRELAALASQTQLSSDAVRAAAVRYTTLRKERHDR